MSRSSKKTRKQVEFMTPGEGQCVGLVLKSMGNGRYMVTTKEGREINAHVRGKLTRQRFSLGTAVIVEEYLNISNIIYIYQEIYKKQLRELDLLPNAVDVYGERIDDKGIEFDYQEQETDEEKKEEKISIDDI